MTATGFNAGMHASLVGQMENLCQTIRESGEATVKNFAALTSEGLQGNAAEATRGLGSEIQAATMEADQTLNMFRQRTTQFGDNMTAHDARTASAIG